MPYLEQEDKDKILCSLRSISKDIFDDKINTVGQLNFIITTIIHTFIEKNGTNYTNLNNMIGVLECVKQEYYRRIVSNYEEDKILLNGDIYIKNNDDKYICKDI